MCYKGCSGNEQDKHTKCPTWETEGFCERNSQYYNFMMKMCRASCRNCASKLTLFGLEFFLVPDWRGRGEGGGRGVELA